MVQDPDPSCLRYGDWHHACASRAGGSVSTVSVFPSASPDDGQCAMPGGKEKVSSGTNRGWGGTATCFWRGAVFRSIYKSD